MQGGTTQPTPRHRGGRGRTTKAHTRTTPHHREGGNNPQPHRKQPTTTPQGRGGEGGGGRPNRDHIYIYMYTYICFYTHGNMIWLYTVINLHFATYIREKNLSCWGRRHRGTVSSPTLQTNSILSPVGFSSCCFLLTYVLGNVGVTKEGFGKQRPLQSIFIYMPVDSKAKEACLSSRSRILDAPFEFDEARLDMRPSYSIENSSTKSL